VRMFTYAVMVGRTALVMSSGSFRVVGGMVGMTYSPDVLASVGFV
jgi:hypothetical protein